MVASLRLAHEIALRDALRDDLLLVDFFFAIWITFSLEDDVKLLQGK